MLSKNTGNEHTTLSSDAFSSDWTLPREKSMLDFSLEYAARGWPVFPCNPENKKPLVPKGHNAATIDPVQISAWWKSWPDAQIGVPMGRKVGFWALDLDQPDGLETCAILEDQHGHLPSTWEQRTGGGGIQQFFAYPKDGREVRNSASKLGKDIDVRGEGGYVIMPPSGHPSGGRYSWVFSPDDTPLADAPAWLLALAAKRPEKAIEAGVCAVESLDDPSFIFNATDYLRERAPRALEGDGGDHTTFVVAAKLRDMGLSETVALQLLLREWNEDCSPPWDADELEVKVGNAYRYASKTAPGAETAEGAFGNDGGLGDAILSTQIALCALAKAPITKTDTPFATLASDIRPEDISPRAWVLGVRLIAGYVTVTVAPGGVGKSTLTILELLSVASGKELSGSKVHKPGAVWLYNAEDPIDELRRRVTAACMLHDIPISSMRNFHITSGQDHPLSLVRDTPRTGLQVNEGMVQKIIKYIRDNGIRVMVLDPFVRTHQVNENDNGAVDHVARTLSRIAGETGCAVHVVHHTRKKGPNGADGDMDSARGASSLVSAARISYTMGTMSEKDAPKWGIPKERHRWYARLDDSKANMSPPGEAVNWFEKVSVSLPCGDSVGAMRAVLLTPQEEVKEAHALKEIRAAVAARVRPGDRVSVNAVAEAVMADADVLFALESGKAPSVRTMARRLKEVFYAVPVVWNDREYSLVEGKYRGNTGMFITCEEGL